MFLIFIFHTLRIMHILSLGVLGGGGGGGCPFVFKFSSFNYPIFGVFFKLLVCFICFYMLSVFRLFFFIFRLLSLFWD